MVFLTKDEDRFFSSGLVCGSANSERKRKPFEVIL